MQLKVFRLREGKLEFTGTREPRAGDAIIEGSTLMSEVRPGVLELRESSNLVPPTKAELERARQSRGHDALAASYRAGHPKATDAEVNAFCQGRAPDPPCESLDDSIRAAHPTWTDKQIAIFKRGR
jgi:hypothetical protein